MFNPRQCLLDKKSLKHKETIRSYWASKFHIKRYITGNIKVKIIFFVWYIQKSMNKKDQWGKKLQVLEKSKHGGITIFRTA